MPPTTQTRSSSATDAPEIVKWYTRARRFPQLIGKTPDGATIWGGPYTYTQVIAGVLFIVVGSKTTWLWGHFGLIGNTLLLLGAAYGLVVLLGRLPIGSRNPLSVTNGMVRALSSPAAGHLGGRPLRTRRPHRVRSRVVVSPTPPSARTAPHQAPAAAPKRQRRRWPRPRWSRPAPSQLPVPVGHGKGLRPTPATVRTTPTPALTGVQRLLASAGPPRQED